MLTVGKANLCAFLSFKEKYFVKVMLANLGLLGNGELAILCVHSSSIAAPPSVVCKLLVSYMRVRRAEWSLGELASRGAYG